MRKLFFLLLAVTLASCAHREVSETPVDPVPFDQRLSRFAALHNTRQTEALRTCFTRDALIQSPVTPRPAGVAQFLGALQADPYAISFSNTETIYSLPGRAVTRSVGSANAPGRFALKETVTVDWRVEDGDWRIARLRFTEWPVIIGTWRKAGRKNEGSLELRVMPGGQYVIYTGDDYSMPTFKGRYRLEGNRITFADTFADNPRDFQPAEGTYLFVREGNGVNLRKVGDDNTWRSERFEGTWSAR
jgi:hypothetical protein